MVDVSRPLLGADFLQENALLVDLKSERMVDTRTYHSVCLGKDRALVPCLNAIAASANEFVWLLSEFPDITTPNFTQLPIKHGVEHFISTQGPPISTRAHRLPPDKLQVARAEFDNMEAMGIIRRSASPWTSPLHLVPKTSGGWQPCGDYRCLNNATVPDKYQVPHMQEFSAPPCWNMYLFQNRFDSKLSPDPSGHRRHT